MRRGALLAWLLAAAAVKIAGDPVFILNTGHSGPVTGLEYQPALKVLVSAGSDGTVKVWDTGSFTPRRTHRLGSRPILLMTVHPQKPFSAAVCEGDETYLVTVWDWDRNQELYTLALPDKPLFIDFSPRGTYLVVCVENWKSLLLFNADQGTAVDLFTQGFGIISFATFSSKETSLMTYQPSGKIIYWNVGSAKKMSEFKARAGLVPVMLSGDKLQFICVYRDQLMFLDALSGKETSVLELGGQVVTRGERSGAGLASVSQGAGARENIRFLAVSGGAAREVFSVAFGESVIATALVVAEEAVFAGTRGGEIFKVQKTGAAKVVRNKELGVSDFTVLKNKLILGTRDRFLVLKGDFIGSGKIDPALQTEIGCASFSHPFPGHPVGLAVKDDNSLYVWKNSGALAQVDAKTFVLKRQMSAFSSPAAQVEMQGGYLLSVEQSGICRLTSPDDGDSPFQFQSAGINAALFVPPSRIFLGKSRLSTYETALAMVETTTGETTYLPETAEAVCKFTYDEKKNVMYYVAVERGNDSPVTVIRSRSPQTLKNEAVIYSKPGRLFLSAIAGEPEQSRLYFSFEDNILFQWDGTVVKAMDPAPWTIRKILPRQNAVYALHDNSAVTVWDAETGLVSYSFYAFENLSWLLLTREGYYAVGERGGEYFSMTEAGSEDRELRERYRLPITLVKSVMDSP